MANISAIKLPDNSTYDIKDNSAARGNAGIFYGTCATVADTAIKAVTCAEFTASDLKPGAVINVYFSVTNSAAVANLQLNVNGTGAKPIKYIYNGSYSNIPGAAYIKLNQIYQFTYDGTNWIIQMIYNTNSDTTYCLYYSTPKAGPGGIFPYTLILPLPDGRYSSIVTSSGTGTSKTRNTSGFLPSMVFYYPINRTLTEDTTNSNDYLKESSSLIDLRYSGNKGTTLTSKASVYLVGSIGTDGLFYLDSDWITQTIPTSANEKVYLFLGEAYDTYRIDLDAYNPMFKYTNGAFRQISVDSITTNGHTVNADVPANAKFTDTVTTATTTGSGNAVTSITASNGALTITKGTTFLTSHQDISGKADKATTLAGYGITNAYTKTEVDNLFDELPEPMIFKGSVGTGGIITSLPTATTDNEGWTYKVITALSSPAAKVGDTVISNGSSWVVIPSGDEPSGTVTSVGISNGGGLSISGSPITSSGTITVSHADTSSQASSSNSGRTYIQSITLDTYGHVTALSTATETVTNTDTKLKVAEVTSATQYYPLVGTGTTAAERQYDTTGFKYKGTTGTTGAVGSAILELGNSTASGTAGNKQGQLIMYGTNAKKATITLAAPSADIALALPTSGGTLALASQIPTIPSSTGSATTGITASTTATKTTLGTAFTIPNVTSAGSASSWVFEEITIPNVTSAGSASTWTFEEKTIPNVTSVGSASTWAFTSKTVVTGVTFTMDTTDTKKLKITTSTDTVYSKSSGSNGTAPTLGTAIKVQSKSGGGNGTAPTLGTAIKVQSKKSGANGSAPTLGTAFTVPNVTGNTSATVSITDNGHTHTI